MKLFLRLDALKLFVIVLAVALFSLAAASAEQNPGAKPTSASTASPQPQLAPIPLSASSTMSVPSEMGGAFMFPSKCDEDGNLYIRNFAGSHPLLGPVAKIDSKGERKALFDQAAFSQLSLDRTDAFTPASDGGLDQVAQKGIEHPQIYVLHFSPDGSAGSSVKLEASLQVYTFAAFRNGNLLISGLKHDVSQPDVPGQTFTAVFTPDGRFLKEISFENADSHNAVSTGPGANKPSANQATAKAGEKKAPLLDLSQAEAGSDGNIYTIRPSPPAVYVITPQGKIARTLTITIPRKGFQPTAFYISGNQLAISFSGDEDQNQLLEVVDAQTGRKIRLYSYDPGLGGSDSSLVPAFGCFDANEASFTFLELTEGNSLRVIRAQGR